MYLARIWLNHRKREARGLLASPQAMHAAVLSSFPPMDAVARDDGARVLWRVDASPKPALYIASPELPDVGHLKEQAGWDTPEGGAVRSYGPFLDSIVDGHRYAFRLTANPTHAVKSTPDGSSKRMGHVTVAQQRRWLLDRMEGKGFAVAVTAQGEADVVVADRVVRSFRRGGRTVTLATATFDGVLDVTDAKAFRRALVAGIGPAKGYGCGLMTVVPVG
ncbi:type I-E CRISPR-associated protein Cas6/Cse3/CasE [Actinorhabdospora filicis]|uniref:Type I-E CRISPR-associated protein Cas6/Cse3/CasE n=1 Tax=Actinorhabdospora filicis TaxID=1785913 RepID=A0A9W6SKZ0_9ACTN|nr:type I-E CRISPR-associated protein Cas6/Cse3/CasE [Actinorhabdospora filicis]GLZ77717.1 type I-E CRISPR-associated protein Cas6/Cse3/CasE [Actinorhabdospora filicis]